MSEVIIIYLIFFNLKSVIIGSDFSFYYWLKYGKQYYKWYSERETFEQYLKKKKEEKRIIAEFKIDL